MVEYMDDSLLLLHRMISNESVSLGGRTNDAEPRCNKVLDGK